MAERPATITYSIAEPFQKALKSLRKAFAAQGLEVASELNISDRIRQKLLIGTVPCMVLLVSPPAETARALASDSAAAALTPMHVVVSGCGFQSEVHVLRILPAGNISLDNMAMTALNQLQADILQAVEKIGMRLTLTT